MQPIIVYMQIANLCVCRVVCVCVCMCVCVRACMYRLRTYPASQVHFDAIVLFLQQETLL